MPIWYYIDGCPLPAECCRRQTTDKKKKLTFCGRTVRAAQTKCCNHLVGSDLHNKKRSKAWEIAEAQEIKTYEEETDDEADGAEDVEDPPIAIGAHPNDKRIRLAIEAPPEDDAGAEDDPAGDPLIGDIADKVQIVMEQRRNASSSSSAMVPTIRASKNYIKDAEEAAYKAQDIAMKAAMAFGDVAQKLGRARDSLEGR